MSEDEKLRFHIVHSVKGGCGKTAFSLFKAMALAAEKNEKSHAQVLLLDVDLKGSGLKALIYGKNEQTYDNNKSNNITLKDIRNSNWTAKTDTNAFVFGDKYQGNTLNQYLSGECKTLSEIIIQGAVVSSPEGNSDEKGFNGWLDFIFVSSEDKDKRAFRYIEDIPAKLNMGKFQIKMRKLLKGICSYGAKQGTEDGKNRGQYQDVVIDMPPGYDDYAVVLCNLIRELEIKDKRKIELHYYVVTTADRSHLEAAQELVQMTAEEPGKGRLYEKVYAVFNEVHHDEFMNGDASCIKGFLGETDIDFKKIYCAYNEKYLNYCREQTKETFGYMLVTLP